MTQAITGRTLEANGLTFAIDEAGQGDTTALLLHGFPESKESWLRQLPALAELGWHVAAPDLRGYGGTSRPKRRSDYRIDHLIDDVGGLFDRLGGKRRILIGHDWGGVIAWATALSGRVPLDGLVILNAPHPAVFARVLKSSWEQRARSWYVLFFQLPFLPELQLTAGGGRALAAMFKRQSPNMPQAFLDAVQKNVAQPGAATAMINYYRANMARLGAAPVVPPLTTPTLMIWGENDIALSLSLTEGNEAWVKDFTLKRIPGASHWVQQDAPEAVNATIAEWARSKRLA